MYISSPSPIDLRSFRQPMQFITCDMAYKIVIVSQALRTAWGTSPCLGLPSSFVTWTILRRYVE